MFNTLALLVTFTALVSYLNRRFFRLPATIGLMVIALVFSLVLLAGNKLGLGLEPWAHDFLAQIDFEHALMNGMLSFLLFAGALHISLDDLARAKWSIGLLATLSVVLCTGLVGVLFHTAAGLLGYPIPWIYAFLFGALISPTDPVAVLGILKETNVPDGLRIKIAGESLFNDGVGVVVFAIILSFVGDTGHAGDTHRVAWPLLLLQEAGGGIVLGLVLGLVTYFLLRGMDHYSVEILLTLALVMGGYALAQSLHVSGPITTVVAGLLIGNHGRHFAMSDRTREHLDSFWELIDEFLNAVLFVLIGLEVLILTFKPGFWAIGLLSIILVLASRLVAVSVPITLLRQFRSIESHAIKILTWAGLRGGISVALALSLPDGSERDLILATTYIVVVFSVLVQGLTIQPLIARTAGKN